MEQLFLSFKKTGHLHHAYFIVGDLEKTLTSLYDFLEKKVGVNTLGNPDFLDLKYATLNISDARFIGESSGRKNDKKSRQIFLISADFITEEAQNSLLKILEEPTENTHFFIISPQDLLLPTLRSRMHVILDKTNVTEKKSILNLKLNKRLELVKEITEAISDEEKTKQDAILLLNQIEDEIHNSEISESAVALKVCELTRASLYDRGAPIKMILENLMISI